jgi:hypothetical protein
MVFLDQLAGSGDAEMRVDVDNEMLAACRHRDWSSIDARGNGAAHGVTAGWIVPLQVPKPIGT